LSVLAFEEVVAEFPEFLGEGAGEIVVVLGEELLGFFGIPAMELEGLAFNGGQFGEGLVLVFFDGIVDHVLGAAPIKLSELGNAAEGPGGRITVEFIFITDVEVFGQFGDAGIDGDTRGEGWIIKGEPGDAADVIGQPITGLNDGGIGTTGDSNGAETFNGTGF